MEILTKDQATKIRANKGNLFDMQKAEAIEKTKQVYLKYSQDKFADINNAIEWAAETKHDCTRAVCLSVPYEIANKEHLLFDFDAVASILKDRGYTHLMQLTSHYHKHNRFYFPLYSPPPVKIGDIKGMEITIHYNRHHWFFWKPVEVRVYFSLYLGDKTESEEIAAINRLHEKIGDQMDAVLEDQVPL